jgi:DsbC/DsbD-like thiol-disulfide interchange protein
MIRAFGVFNEGVPKGNMAYGIPIPITLIVDPNGIVNAKFLDEDYRQRYTAANILARRYGVTFRAAMDETVGKHARIVSSASNSSVRGGQHIALILDVELQAGVHVYAPGVQPGYIPIEWKLSDSPTWTNTTIEYPEPKRVELLGETVPAYDGKIRITREITIAPQRQTAEASNGDGEFVIEGSFRYQACDERQCFIPETIPLKWLFRLERMDTERAPAELRRK